MSFPLTATDRKVLVYANAVDYFQVLCCLEAGLPPPAVIIYINPKFRVWITTQFNEETEFSEFNNLTKTPYSVGTELLKGLWASKAWVILSFPYSSPFPVPEPEMLLIFLFKLSYVYILYIDYSYPSMHSK